MIQKDIVYGTKLLLFIISQVRSAAMMMSHCSCTPTDILISRDDDPSPNNQVCLSPSLASGDG